MVSPSFWHEKDDEPLIDTVSVYGIDDLQITSVGEQRFQADFLKWEQPLTETMAYLIRNANATVRVRRDLLTFEYNGKYWLIVEIDRQIDTYLTDDKYEKLAE